MASIAARLRAYRPSATVLEAQVAPARSGEGAGRLSRPGMKASQGPADFLGVMRQKRGAHDKTIKACCYDPLQSCGSLLCLSFCALVANDRIFGVFQMSRKQHENKAAGEAVGPDNALAMDSGALRRAAINAAMEGDQPLQQGRFQDATCFIPSIKAARYEEEGFAVHRSGADDAMSSAVLDLMEDDTARNRPPDMVMQDRSLDCSVRMHSSCPFRLNIQVCPWSGGHGSTAAKIPLG